MVPLSLPTAFNVLSSFRSLHWNYLNGFFSLAGNLTDLVPDDVMLCVFPSVLCAVLKTAPSPSLAMGTSILPSTWAWILVIPEWFFPLPEPPLSTSSHSEAHIPLGCLSAPLLKGSHVLPLFSLPTVSPSHLGPSYCLLGLLQEHSRLPPSRFLLCIPNSAYDLPD